MKPINKGELKVGHLYLELKKGENPDVVIRQPQSKRMVQRFRRVDHNGLLVFCSITYFELIYSVSEKKFEAHDWFDVSHLYGSNDLLKRLNII